MEHTDLHKTHKSPGGFEGRITNIIITHWQQVRGNKLLPSEQDLDADILEAVLDNCFLISAAELQNSGSHKYIYIGKNIVEAYGSNITTATDNAVDPLSHKNKFHEVFSLKQPVIDEGEFINKNQHLVKYRQCLVPLSKDGQNIDSIFGGMRFKVFM